jgi:hypothetical protein
MTHIKIPTEWQIKNLDEDEVILPPYPISENGVRISGVGGNIVKQERMGFQNPIVQWTSGLHKTITFTSVLFAEDTEADIKNELVQFENLTLRNDKLGRPPICVFSLGSQISETVIVESIDQDISPVRPEGKLRQVTLDITLVKYKPFSQVQIDATKPGKESYYLVVTRAEASYEEIAKRYYGNPLQGDRLRKRHPEMPLMPTVGSTVNVPAKSIILREVVEPEFHALSLTNEDAVARFESILKTRATRKAYI